MIRHEIKCPKCQGVLGIADSYHCPHCGADLTKIRQEEFRKAGIAAANKVRKMIKDEEKIRKRPWKDNGIRYAGSPVYSTAH